MSTIKVICKKKKSTDKVAYLRLSTRIGNKTVLKSLQLNPIDPKHFNPKTGRLRASFAEAEYYNNFIESKLAEANKRGNSIKYLNDDKKSFIEYMERVIERTENWGTIQKYTGIKNLIIDYNKRTYGISDLKFTEITVDYLEGFRKYLKAVRRNKQNSIVYKMKCFKSFITKAHKDKEYTYEVNPFDHIKNTIIETTVDILNKDDLKKLMNANFVEVYRSGKKFGQPLKDLSVLNGAKYKNYNTLEDIRNFFLFQLFCQGIRVSDLLTLRWQDFYIDKEQIRIKKRMVKVRSYIDVLVNFNTMDYLFKYVPIDKLPEELKVPFHSIWYMKIHLLRSTLPYNDEQDGDKQVAVEISDTNVKLYNLKFKGVSGKYYLSTNQINELIVARSNELAKKYKIDDAVELSKIISKDEKTTYLNSLLQIIKEKVISESNEGEEYSNKIKIENYQRFASVIDFLAHDKETKRMFCFPLLNDGDFSDIIDDDFSAMNEYQYSKFTGRRAYYNRLLKCVAEQSGINKRLTSHLSRHSFTSLMIDIGENLNLFDLMTSLGHKHLTTTQNYIKQFSSKRIDSVNLNLVKYLNK